MRAPASLRFMAVILLACAVNLATAEETTNRVQTKPCDKIQYPPESIRLHEEGITEIGFLIGTDGLVKKTVILNPSGSATLDRAPQEILSTCVFRPVTWNGQPIPVWASVSYHWFLEDDPDMSRVSMRLDLALQKKQDDANALYYYALLKLKHPASIADQEHARALLKHAADLGHVHAQFKIGQFHEQGIGGPADQAEALRWYKKAAAQGDVFAIQRLETDAPVP